ncbi:VirB3 family type IV secretion system protein, partial [Pseudoalteromonas sp. NZS100_1]|nr:VirB3 family type IV secretion system protein [Pseudoalteromonas sp. NZS100_1]
MDGQEEMTKDPLFLAVTRPALWAGVPIEAGALIIMAGAITLVGSGNPLYGGAAAVALYAMARLIVRHDVNAFRLIFLWGRTKAANRNRVFWGGSSYTPLPLYGIKRKGFGRGVREERAR